MNDAPRPTTRKSRRRTEPGPDPPPAARRPWRDPIVAAALVALVAAVYGQTAGHSFVYLDDDRYVFENPHVRAGLSAEGIRWAFTQFHSSNWHPLTWLSHMLDCRIFGASQASAGGHHLVSAGIHAANAVLLHFALRSLTGAFWPCVAVAAFFAVHPLRVESVAWVAERKDVLSGLFFMLTLLAYSRYARRPGGLRYGLVLLAFALGLLSKPMLVTAPFVLLLLDVWPLRRWTWGLRAPESAPSALAPRALLLEKAPLLLMVAGASALTFAAQRQGGAVMGVDYVTPAWRIVGALIGYVTYLGKTLWPSGLAPFYIHPATVPAASIDTHVAAAAGAALLLAAITWLALRVGRRKPYWITGWFWYLGMLVPVIGIVQVGAQLWADRYAYLPTIGIYLVAVWSLRDATARSPAMQRGALALAGVVVLAWGALAHAQAARWRDSGVLFEHAVRVTRDNWVLENNLGAYLSLDDPDSPEARRHLEASLRIKPGFTDAHRNLAEVLAEQGAHDEALDHFGFAIAGSPENVAARIGIASLLVKRGRLDEARVHLEEALRREPRHAEAMALRGMIDAASGRTREARERLETAARLDPRSALALHLLARLLATAADPAERDPARAIALAQRAAELSAYRRSEVLVTLGAAHASAGDFDAALRWERRAAEFLRPHERNAHLGRMERYRAREPLVSGK